MAQVETDLTERIERLLERSHSSWFELPQVAAEFGSWELLEQHVFVEDWPLEEEQLAELSRYAAAGLLTTAQNGHYRRLLSLVERHRPIIRRLQHS